MNEDYSNCPTGCQDPKHMFKCINCGTRYHIGIVHQCPTSPIFEPIHCHLSWFGSELACSECNPVCYEKHQMDNPNHLQWCGHEKCPMKPKEPIVLDSPLTGVDEDWNETEDDIRKLKRKSIRKGGKYKERGKEKRREP